MEHGQAMQGRETHNTVTFSFNAYNSDIIKPIFIYYMMS